MASSPRSHPVYSITERTSLFMYDDFVTQVTKRICLKFHPASLSSESKCTGNDVIEHMYNCSFWN